MPLIREETFLCILPNRFLTDFLIAHCGHARHFPQCLGADNINGERRERVNFSAIGYGLFTKKTHEIQRSLPENNHINRILKSNQKYLI